MARILPVVTRTDIECLFSTIDSSKNYDTDNNSQPNDWVTIGRGQVQTWSCVNYQLHYTIDYKLDTDTDDAP